MEEVTELLRRAHEGDPQAFDEVIPLVYEELKKLAARYVAREYDPASLQTTMLVHEAFLRLAGTSLPECENRSHFFGIAARVMRQVLVDMARARQAAKRAPEVELPLADLNDFGAPDDETFVALNDALDRLAIVSPLKAKLIEMRFFAGLTADESARVVSLPVHLIRRELRLAKAWLRNELSG